VVLSGPRKNYRANITPSIGGYAFSTEYVSSRELCIVPPGLSSRASYGFTKLAGDGQLMASARPTKSGSVLRLGLRSGVNPSVLTNPPIDETWQTTRGTLNFALSFVAEQIKYKTPNTARSHYFLPKNLLFFRPDL
jgi:hypothetical protein